MNGTLSRLQCRLRVRGPAQRLQAMLTRTDAPLRDVVARAYDDALSQRFANDPHVYVVRRAEVRCAIPAHTAAELSKLPTLLGQQMAQAVERGILSGGVGADGATGVAQFADEADYAAHFVAAVLQGTAWSQWQYGALMGLQSLPLREVIQQVLFNPPDLFRTPHPAHIPVLLARLHQQGMLNAVFAHLPSEDIHRLMDACAADANMPDALGLRPLIEVALHLADVLSLWTTAAPSPDWLLAQCARERIAPPDWRDPRALAEAVLDMLAVLFAQGHISAAALSQVSPAKIEGVLQKLAGLDWLDGEFVFAGLMTQEPARRAHEGLAARFQRQVQQAASTDIRSELTAHQTQIVHRLIYLIQQGDVGDVVLDEQTAQDEAHKTLSALRLYAALVAAMPEVTNDPIALHLVQAVLADAHLFSKEPNKKLTRENAHVLPEVVLPTQNTTVHAAPPPKQQDLAAVHADGDAIEFIESAAAGIFLLVRAVLDVRLPALVEAAALGSLLAALGQCWAGDVGEADPGITLFAGFVDEVPSSEMQLAQVSQPLQVALLDTWVAHRLLSRDSLQVLRLDWRGYSALACASDSLEVWPLGAIATSAEEEATLLAQWPTQTPTQTQTPPTALLATLAALNEGHSHEPALALPLCLMANGLLRLWARWLRQFANSSTPYLLREFVRRPGRIAITRDALHVTLASRPLDMVLRMAGYFDDIGPVAWLGERRIVFRVEAGA